MTHNRRLLIIDPQNDFCDIDARDAPSGETPALPVPGAHADMQRLAAALTRSCSPNQGGPGQVSALAVTLDTHQRWDIAHPTYWQTGNGDHVPPFTAITAAQVRAGTYLPRDTSDLARTLDYLDALERQGRYTLMVWPVHCVQDSWGHHLHADIGAACEAWTAHTGQTVYSVTKGLNPYTEHYSALQAEVPDDRDPGTQLNHTLLAWAAGADTLLIAGEASSHCVRATVEHLVAHLGPAGARRITLLVDCMSPVDGFKDEHETFLAQMRAHGVKLAKVADVLGSSAA